MSRLAEAGEFSIDERQKDRAIPTPASLLLPDVNNCQNWQNDHTFDVS